MSPHPRRLQLGVGITIHEWVALLPADNYYVRWDKEDLGYAWAEQADMETYLKTRMRT